MKMPTYYEGLVDNISLDKYEHEIMWLSCDRNGGLYDIYYYGEIIDGYIASFGAPALIVAKSVKSGDEIVLFDGAVHGYDNMFCDSHPQNEVSSRTLKKLDTPPSRVKILVEYSIDYEEERDQYDFTDDNTVKLIDGGSMPWEDVKRNGITWLAITLIDNNGDENHIVDVELA